MKKKIISTNNYMKDFHEHHFKQKPYTKNSYF